ncbi:MAG: DNA-3-methyladenine glycosylase, partial [Glutamicibacter protophormiae]
LSMRVLADPDAWMRNDVALVSGAARLGILEQPDSKSASHRLLEDYAQRWSPWRSYASMHLWQAASG